MRLFHVNVVALSVLFLASYAGPAAAQSKGMTERLQKLFDPKVIGVEAALQGEYRGMAGTKAFAAQVVNRGDRRFHALVYNDGLPGDGWDGSAYLFLESETLVDGSASFRALKAKGVTALLDEKGFTLTTKDDKGLLPFVNLVDQDLEKLVNNLADVYQKRYGIAHVSQ